MRSQRRKLPSTAEATAQFGGTRKSIVLALLAFYALSRLHGLHPCPAPASCGVCMHHTAPCSMSAREDYLPQLARDKTCPSLPSERLSRSTSTASSPPHHLLWLLSTLARILRTQWVTVATE
ncbi:uncharacterized protein PV06_07595 [Exophiala oligosperma]|uniref:Uncharacterized protein n=1 Tax=Exophiala oligosperma TaxID=215243 RepID=A0A0D2BSG6_9EURO|nr:uncharacterized protein PV06_07595 [Exophiala oligosperma]KIW40392.1 hypothetical protein PV06_07595 [Exophiala oligosperma]